jgi:hypothetical protein
MITEYLPAQTWVRGTKEIRNRGFDRVLTEARRTRGTNESITSLYMIASLLEPLLSGVDLPLCSLIFQR